MFLGRRDSFKEPFPAMPRPEPSPTPASSPPIFFDPTQRRGRLLLGLSAASGALVAAGIAVFVLSVMVTPVLPVPPFARSVLRHAGSRTLPLVAAHDHALKRHIERNAREALLAAIARERQHSAPKAPLAVAPPTISAAFYVPWQETGLHSLRAHASQLTHLLPVWLRLGEDGAALDTSNWDPRNTPHNEDVAQIARRHRVRIVPVLTNASADGFDRTRVQRLLGDETRQAAFALAIGQWLSAHGFDGVNIDFENLEPSDYARLPAFLERLRAVLAASGRSLSVDVEVEPARSQLPAIAQACDFVVIMAYDEHWQTSPPGPIASLGWYRDVLKDVVRQVPASKLVMGMAGYAYDWPTAGGPAEALGFQQALQRAADNHAGESVPDIVRFDPGELQPSFEYSDEADAPHEVWMQDAVTVANEWELARREGVRGAALWALGMEDPSCWNVLGPANMAAGPRPDSLRQIEFPYDVEFDGDGEILEVGARPTAGRRQLEFQASTGLIWDEHFEVFPTTYVIRRSGLHPKTIALTFDDGPAAPYTGQVLDLLHKLAVPATFFVIGQSAEANPNLITRIYAEGHELGNHTYTHPNIGAISSSRARLELNATQRALQTLIGRSTILFRPPYNADAEPTSAEEVQPIITASELGYVTIGEYIDPRDWDFGQPEAPRSASDIASSVIEQAHAGHGNAVLLHDGGGDRSRTVAALPIIVNSLRSEGYRFVSVSELASATRAQVMPALEARELMLVGADRVSFEVVHAVDATLTLCFYLGIVLGVVRIAWVTVLAVLARRRERGRPLDPSYRPRVSVLIAAHNEAKVIARTINGILDSDYPHVEVVVVDDGSTDTTAEVVAQQFGAEPRVVLLRQKNAGKGAALNNAIAHCSGEILIGLDADTIFARDAVAKLTRHFSDPAVGAVAGNVKVGNRINVLTQWQSIEYITSQNLDRRAYSLLNAVTVVPGAVGAWRRRAVEGVRGYLADTMAEDMDLTWRLRLAGWKIQSDVDAIAYTEAPDTWAGLAKQRFRWAYGTLQCLWKHRRALGRHGWFGRVVLPTLWLFQIAFQLIAPLVDLALLWSLGLVAWHWSAQATALHEWAPLPADVAILLRIAFLYALFFVVDFAGALLAFRFDKENPSALVWLFWQRFLYRQLMYGVVLKSLRTALQGLRTGWGKLERKGTVKS